MPVAARPMSGNPLSTLRAHDDVTVSVAVGLVSGGLADAWVSVGHTGAAVAAAVLGLGRIAGMSRPALAVVVPALAGPVVLVDAGAAPDATPDVLRQFALAGWAYARALGVADPVGGTAQHRQRGGQGRPTPQVDPRPAPRDAPRLRRRLRRRGRGP